MITDKGTITCEHVVNAAGLWAKQVGRMAGWCLYHRKASLSHLDSIPELETLDFEVPMTVDLGFYLRQDQNGVLWPSNDHEHWAMDGAP